MADLDATTVTNLTVSGTQSLVPVGTIMMWFNSTIPDGFLRCNGGEYSTSAYAALFAAIGYAYGSGSGTFKVPNLEERHAIGAGTFAVNASGGSLSHTHTVAATHNHTLNSHTHTLNSHTHATTSHTHHTNNHTHTIASHYHTLASHQHSLNSHSHSGTTGGPNVTDELRSGQYSVSSSTHTHYYTTTTNNHYMDSQLDTTSSSSASAKGDTTVGGANSVTSSANNSVTGTNSTTSSSAGTGSLATLVTIKYVVVNYIIKA